MSHEPVNRITSWQWGLVHWASSSVNLTEECLGTEITVYVLIYVGTKDWESDRLNSTVNTSGSWLAHS